MRSCFALLFMVVSSAAAQSPIEYSAATKVWLLHTESSAYAMGVNARGELQNLYWGGPIWRIADIPAAQAPRELSSFDPSESLMNEEFAGWGSTRYPEPAVKITRAGAGRDLVLHYVSHTIEGDDLRIVMKDIQDDIFVTLSYHVYAGGRHHPQVSHAGEQVEAGAACGEPAVGHLVHASRGWLSRIIRDGALGV